MSGNLGGLSLSENPNLYGSSINGSEAPDTRTSGNKEGVVSGIAPQYSTSTTPTAMKKNAETLGAQLKKHGSTFLSGVCSGVNFLVRVVSIIVGTPLYAAAWLASSAIMVATSLVIGVGAIAGLLAAGILGAFPGAIFCKLCGDSRPYSDIVVAFAETGAKIGTIPGNVAQALGVAVKFFTTIPCGLLGKGLVSFGLGLGEKNEKKLDRILNFTNGDIQALYKSLKKPEVTDNLVS